MRYKPVVPVVLRHGPYRFLFFSNEGLPREPAHVHVRRGRALAKIALEPTVDLVASFGFASKDLRAILRLARLHRDALRRRWDAFFR